MSARSTDRLVRGLRLFVFAVVSTVLLLQAPSCRTDRGAPKGGGPEVTAPAPAVDADPKAPVTRQPGASDDIIAADELDGGPCRQEGAECAPGYLCCAPCCLSGEPLECTRAVEGQCPLPDLTISEAALARGVYMDTIEAGECELEEKCLSGTGTRRVLRFDVRVPNQGVTDLVLGDPDAGVGKSFEYAPCHDHFHFLGFARYTLLDDDGNALVVGRKQAFCARDSARVDPAADPTPKYDCENQGIQRGWQDIYDPSLPCQYLDVTDVPSGTYWLEVEVNPERVMTELRYDNNLAKVKVVVP